MIICDVEQGSPEWIQARLGIPTASQFHRILTPKTRKPSAQSERYLHECLTEWLLGVPMEIPNSPWMERGTQLEGQAREFYEYVSGNRVERVGFVLRDDGMVGCSPDALVGSYGGLEIKCPSAVNHVAFMLNTDHDHICQVQGCIWICERDWWDLCVYNPTLQPQVIRIHRDDELISALAKAVDGFVERLHEGREKLLATGHEPRKPQKCPVSGVDLLVCRCEECESRRTADAEF